MIMKKIIKLLLKIFITVSAAAAAVIIIGIAVLYLTDCSNDTPSEPTYVDCIFDSLPEEKDIKSKSSGLWQGYEELNILYYDDISDYFVSERNQYFFKVNERTAAYLTDFIKSFEDGALFKFKFDYSCIDSNDWVAFVNPRWTSESEVGQNYALTSRQFLFFDSQTSRIYYFFQEL